MKKRNFMCFILAMAVCSGAYADAPDLAGLRQFIVDMYNPELQLCAEAPIAAPDVYWLLNDGLEVATAIKDQSGSRSYRMLEALYTRGHMTNGVVEAFHGQGIPWPPLESNLVVLEDNSPEYVIKMEFRDGSPMTGWANYGDLIAMRAIALHNEGDNEAASLLLDDLFAMWDGTGIADIVQQNHPDGYYATYKLALLLVAADTVGKEVPFRQAVLDRLGSQQRGDGGIVTDYLPDGTPIGDANVETTSHTILAVLGNGIPEHSLIGNGTFELSAAPDYPDAPGEWYHSESGWGWSDTVYRSGTRSVCLDDQSSSTSYDMRAQAVRVDPGMQLRATVFHHQTVTAGVVNVFVRFFADAGATQFISQVGSQISSSNSDFEPLYLFDITVPPNAYYVDMLFLTEADTIGTFYFDDVFLGTLADPQSIDEFSIDNFNLIPNYSVEIAGDPTWPSGWYHSLDNVVWDNTKAVTGESSLKIDDFDYFGAGDWRSQEFAVTEGEVLKFSYFTDYEAVALNFGTFLRWFDANGTWLGQVTDLINGTFPNGTPEFEYREWDVVVPENAVKADIFIFTNDGVNTGTAWYDDLRVENNLVSNAHMEMGLGNDPNDWFHGSMTSREMPEDAPSPYSVLQIDDTDEAAGTDWRSKPFDVTAYSKLSFALFSKRENLVGEPVAQLRFWESVDGSGNNPGGFISEEGFTLEDDTEGFESLSMVVDVPDDAVYADVVFMTGHDVAITGTLQFDGVIVSPTVFLPPCTGDFDGNGVVDEDDLHVLTDCLQGPGVTVSSVCSEADLDRDTDVDLADYALFDEGRSDCQ